MLLQVLPSEAYNKEKVLEHARMYAREFASVGISKDRFCIKIPSTGPALNACVDLAKEGIPTLGTALFGLPQAIAASQAGCIYISPYYNGKYPSLTLGLRKTLASYIDLGFPATQRSKPMMTQSCGPMLRTQPPSTPCLRG